MPDQYLDCCGIILSAKFCCIFYIIPNLYIFELFVNIIDSLVILTSVECWWCCSPVQEKSRKDRGKKKAAPSSTR